MPISLNPSARYVTQSHIYDNHLGAPLSDRRIEHYRKQGYYQSSSILVVKAVKAQRLSRTKFKKKKQGNVFKDL